MCACVQIITSFEPEGGSVDTLTVIAVTKQQQQQRDGKQQLKLGIQKMGGYFTGTGVCV